MNDFAKPSILVADLDTASLAQTVRILCQFDYTVFSAVCYSSAISAAMKLELDLIVCDYSVRNCQPGRDLVADIHELPGRNDVPVIFTSAVQEPDVIRRQHDFGGAYHIKKPLDAKAIKEIVDGALWMPHLVTTHVKRPHFGITTTINTPLGINSTLAAF